MAFFGMIAIMIIAMGLIIGGGIALTSFILFLSRRHKKKHADDGKGKAGYVALRIIALLCLIPALLVLVGIVSAVIIGEFG